MYLYKRENTYINILIVISDISYLKILNNSNFLLYFMDTINLLFIIVECRLKLDIIK